MRKEVTKLLTHICVCAAALLRQSMKLMYRAASPHHVKYEGHWLWMSQWVWAGDEQMNECWVSAEQLVEIQLLGFWTSTQLESFSGSPGLTGAPLSLEEDSERLSAHDERPGPPDRPEEQTEEPSVWKQSLTRTRPQDTTFHPLELQIRVTETKTFHRHQNQPKNSWIKKICSGLPA